MALLTDESFQLFTTGSPAIGVQTINISGPAIQYAGTFKIGSNVTVSGLMTYIGQETGTSPAYWYGLKGFAGGSPAAAWLGSATTTYTSAGWKPLYFPANVALTSGTTYSHIVMPKVGSNPTTANYVRIGVGFSTVQTVPGETDWSYVDTSLQTYTSLNSGVSWTTTNRLPNFILIEQGGGLYGQPYDTEHLSVDVDLTLYARGYSQFGQFIKPTTNIDLSGVGFHLFKVTTGDISGDAWFELRSGNSPYPVIGSWFIVGSQTLGAFTPNWNIIYGIDKTLTSGIPYILSVKSHSDGDVYNIAVLGAKTTANQGSVAGFKGSDSYYAYTYDSGASWTINPMIDILFQLYGSAWTSIVANAWSQWLNETIALAESRRYLGSYWKTETLTTADSKFMAYSGWQSDTLAIADTQWKASSIWKPETLTFGETTAKAGSIWKSDNLILTDSRIMADSIWKTDSLTISDSVLGQLVQFTQMTLSEALAIAENIKSFAYSAWKTDNLTFADSKRFAGSIWKADTLTLADSAPKTPSLNKSDTLAFADTQWKAGSYWKTDSLALGESTRKGMATTKADALAFADSVENIVLIIKSLMETLSLIDSITKAVGTTKVETVTISDSQFKFMGKRIADNLALAESMAKSIIKPFTETLTLNEISAKLMSIRKSETLSISDSIIVDRILNLVENLQILDSLVTAKVSNITLAENLTLSDAFRRIVNLGNLLVNEFASIISDDISDHFDVNRIITDDISGRFGSEFG